MRDSKRFYLTLAVLAFWVEMYLINANVKGADASLAAVGVYFLALISFVGTYLLGESIRPSDKTSVFMKGRNSKREVITYAILITWNVCGVVGIMKGLDLVGLAGYFSTMAPFVGAYILGDTYKSDKKPDVTIVSNTTVTTADAQQTT